MKRQDLLILKENYKEIENTIMHTVCAQEEIPNGFFFTLRKEIMENMAVKFLTDNNKYNDNNYKNLIEYLSEDSYFINNYVYKMIDEK